MMYLRLGVVVAIFNLPLAMDLAGPLAALAAAGGILAAICLWRGGRTDTVQEVPAPEAKNPLEIPAALLFAVLFVLISLGSSWVKSRFGHAGVFALAAIVGVTDIDPFVLSVAQGGVAGLDQTATAIAILIAASSNNLLKAVYSVVFAGWHRSVGVVVSLVILAALGGGIAAWVAYRSSPPWGPLTFIE